MAFTQKDTSVVGATVFFVGVAGASVFPTLIKPDVGQNVVAFKILAAAGSTVQILPRAIAGASVGGATAVVQGYPIGTAEIVTMAGPAAFYLQATGATATIGMMIGYTSGATLA